MTEKTADFSLKGNRRKEKASFFLSRCFLSFVVVTGLFILPVLELRPGSGHGPGPRLEPGPGAMAWAADFREQVKTLFSKKDYAGTIRLCNQMLSKNPQNSFAYSSRGFCFIQLKKDSAAIADFNRAIKLSPKKGNLYYGRGLAYYNLKDYRRAKNDFVRAFKLSPDKSKYSFNLSLAYAKLGNLDLASLCFAKAVQLDPENSCNYPDSVLKILPESSARLLRAVGWLVSGKFQMAVNECSLAQDVNPEDARIYRIRLEAYKLLDEPEMASQERKISAILGPQPQSPSKVSASLQAKEKALMRRAFENLDEGSIKSLAKLRHEHALSILESGSDKSSLEEAAAFALSASELDKNDAVHPYLGGLIFQDLSKKDKKALVMAEKMFEEAVEIDPEHAPAWLELGLMMFAQSRNREAIRAFEHALEADPARVAPYAVGPLVASYAMLDQGLRGLAFFQEQSEANPEVSALGVGAALMQYNLGNKKEALDDARALLLIEDKNTDVHKYLSKLVVDWEKEQ